MDNGGGVER